MFSLLYMHCSRTLLAYDVLAASASFNSGELFSSGIFEELRNHSFAEAFENSGKNSPPPLGLGAGISYDTTNLPCSFTNHLICFCALE